jgi:hypothetical protein
MKGFRQRSRYDEGRGKEDRRGRKPWMTCLKGTHVPDVRGRKNAGKLSALRRKLGVEKATYAAAKIGEDAR